MYGHHVSCALVGRRCRLAAYIIQATFERGLNPVCPGIQECGCHLYINYIYIQTRAHFQTGVVKISFLTTLSNKIACNPVFLKLTNLEPKVTDFFAFINCMQIVGFGVSCPCNYITAASFLLALASNDNKSVKAIFKFPTSSTEPHLYCYLFIFYLFIYFLW